MWRICTLFYRVEINWQIKPVFLTNYRSLMLYTQITFVFKAVIKLESLYPPSHLKVRICNPTFQSSSLLHAWLQFLSHLEIWNVKQTIFLSLVYLQSNWNKIKTVKQTISVSLKYLRNVSLELIHQLRSLHIFLVLFESTGVTYKL